MKQRIVSAAILVPAVIAILFFYESFILNLVISIISFASVYEVLVATKYINNKALSFTSLAFAAIVPFFRMPYFNLLSKLACFIFIVILFVIIIYDSKSATLEQIGLAFMVSLVFSVAFSCLAYLRDEFIKDGLYYICMVFIGAWMTDTGALLVGMAAGKHKLAPSISPKKTVEGAIGGIIITTFLYVCSGIAYPAILKLFGFPVDFKVRFFPLAFLGVLVSAAAIFGDLAASYIKRQCHIKDFGNFMPGHGGVLDRFDSVLMVAPLFYFFVNIIDIIVR